MKITLSITVEAEDWGDAQRTAKRMADQVMEWRTAPIKHDRSGPYRALWFRGDVMSAELKVRVAGEHSE